MIFLIFHSPPLSYSSVVSSSDGGGSGGEMAVGSGESQEELEEEPLVPDQRPQLCVLTTEEGWEQAAS